MKRGDKFVTAIVTANIRMEERGATETAINDSRYIRSSIDSQCYSPPVFPSTWCLSRHTNFAPSRETVWSFLQNSIRGSIGPPFLSIIPTYLHLTTLRDTPTLRAFAILSNRVVSERDVCWVRRNGGSRIFPPIHRGRFVRIERRIQSRSSVVERLPVFIPFLFRGNDHGRTSFLPQSVIRFNKKKGQPFAFHSDETMRARELKWNVPFSSRRDRQNETSIFLLLSFFFFLF